MGANAFGIGMDGSRKGEMRVHARGETRVCARAHQCVLPVHIVF